MRKDSAVGMCLMALDFASCARLVAEGSARGKPMAHVSLPKNTFVFMYLIGHAFELAYKAILVEHGTTECHLKTIGHNLLKCRKNANRCIEEGVATLEHGTTQEIVKLLAPVYKSKAFEYHKTGLYKLPANPEKVVEDTNNTIEKVHRYIKERFRQRQAHHL